MRLFIDYLKPYKLKIALGLIIKFVGTIMDLLIPWILQHLIDNVVPDKNVGVIVFWGVIMLLCSGMGIWGNVKANRIASKVARDSSERIRHDLFKKILYLSCEDVDSYTIPSLDSRLTSDTYNVHHTIGMIQRMGVRAPILLIGGLIVTLSMDAFLTLVLITILPFITLTVYFISKKGVVLYEILQKCNDKMVRIVRENTQGMRVIKALSKNDYEINKFNNVNVELIKSEKKASLTMALTNPLMQISLNLGLTAVIVVGAFRVSQGQSEPGMIIAFLSYFTIILNAMMSVTRIFIMMSKGIASANRINEVMNTENKIKLVEVSKKLGIEEENPYIVFDNVSFSYNKIKNNLSNISFSITKNSTLGIIGGTGSGKTTLIKLLLRLYDVDEGAIFIDGTDLKSIPENELHQKFGIVFQNDFLFGGTIYDNIDFERDISSKNINDSIKNAQADSFVFSKGMGLYHELNARGTNLSGGQKQRILISRALAGDSDILVFDDSSSALDYKTDSQLRKALRENYSDKTVITIAQRVSSIMHCDLIIVLDEGKIVGMGKHDTLMASCDIYQEMSNSQMGGAVID